MTDWTPANQDDVAGSAVLAGTPYILMRKPNEPGYACIPVIALPQGPSNL